ncbi:MAG: glycosyltransferase family 2 protein [Bryobacterales bacterium]|nr:glycosyltransferase family 2 protein [Bryobacterales bacterium]
MSGVTAVVPNWNRRDLLMRLLESLNRQTRPVARIIVADNGSTDGSAEAAATAGAQVVELGRNLGFSRAVNAGLREARTPWVAVLNNDVEVEQDWLERLLDAVERQGAWFGTGRLLDARRRGVIEGTFDTVCRGGCAWRAGHGRPDSAAWREGRAVRMVPFTAALFRASLFEQVGLLDERFESYLEDVDFGLRCSKLGLEGVYAPDAVAYHTGSATLGAWHPEVVRRIARNQLLLVAKHLPKGWVRRYGWRVLVAQGLWGLVALRHGAFFAFLRGKLAGLAQFRAVRNGSGEPGDIDGVLAESERTLRELQEQTGFDWYWRLYFALT